MSEDPSADYEVVGSVELEKEQLSEFERRKVRLSAGLPEIDLVDLRDRPKRFEPISVCDSDVGVDHRPFDLSQEFRICGIVTRV